MLCHGVPRTAVARATKTLSRRLAAATTTKAAQTPAATTAAHVHTTALVSSSNAVPVRSYHRTATATATATPGLSGAAPPRRAFSSLADSAAVAAADAAIGAAAEPTPTTAGAADARPFSRSILFALCTDDSLLSELTLVLSHSSSNSSSNSSGNSSGSVASPVPSLADPRDPTTGATPLLFALAHGAFGAARALVEAGANVTATDSQGRGVFVALANAFASGAIGSGGRSNNNAASDSFTSSSSSNDQANGTVTSDSASVKASGITSIVTALPDVDNTSIYDIEAAYFAQNNNTDDADTSVAATKTAAAVVECADAVAAEPDAEAIVAAMAEGLLALGASPVAVARDGRTLAHAAAEAGCAALLKVAARAGVDLDALPTPLPQLQSVMAAKQGTGGAEKENGDEDEEELFPAVSLAAAHGHPRAVAALLALGASAETRSSLGVSPLAVAVQAQCPRAVAVLVAAGAAVDAPCRVAPVSASAATETETGTESGSVGSKSSSDGMLPLHLAVTLPHPGVTRALLSLPAPLSPQPGADSIANGRITATSSASVTDSGRVSDNIKAMANTPFGAQAVLPLLLALSSGYPAHVPALLQAGASARVRDGAGATALYYLPSVPAEAAGSVLAALLAAGADGDAHALSAPQQAAAYARMTPFVAASESVSEQERETGVVGLLPPVVIALAAQSPLMPTASASDDAGAGSTAAAATATSAAATSASMSAKEAERAYLRAGAVDPVITVSDDGGLSSSALVQLLLTAATAVKPDAHAAASAGINANATDAGASADPSPAPSCEPYVRGGPYAGTVAHAAAATRGQAPLLLWLLRRYPALVNSDDTRGRTPLAVALAAANRAAAAVAVAAGGDVRAATRAGSRAAAVPLVTGDAETWCWFVRLLASLPRVNMTRLNALDGASASSSGDAASARAIVTVSGQEAAAACAVDALMRLHFCGAAEVKSPGIVSKEVLPLIIKLLGAPISLNNATSASSTADSAAATATESASTDTSATGGKRKLGFFSRSRPQQDSPSADAAARETATDSVTASSSATDGEYGSVYADSLRINAAMGAVATVHSLLTVAGTPADLTPRPACATPVATAKRAQGADWDWDWEWEDAASGTTALMAAVQVSTNYRLR